MSQVLVILPMCLLSGFFCSAVINPVLVLLPGFEISQGFYYDQFFLLVLLLAKNFFQGVHPSLSLHFPYFSHTLLLFFILAKYDITGSEGG